MIRQNKNGVVLEMGKMYYKIADDPKRIHIFYLTLDGVAEILFQWDDKLSIMIKGGTRKHWHTYNAKERSFEEVLNTIKEIGMEEVK